MGKDFYFCEGVFFMNQYLSAYSCCRLPGAHQLHIGSCKHRVSEVPVT